MQPLSFSEERANENPLEKWTRVLAVEANSAAKKALGSAWAAISKTGLFSAFSSLQSSSPLVDVRPPFPLHAGAHPLGQIRCNEGPFKTQELKIRPNSNDTSR